jgi:hypothetical protein
VEGRQVKAFDAGLLTSDDNPHNDIVRGRMVSTGEIATERGYLG